MTKILPIESGALAVPEPDTSGVHSVQGVMWDDIDLAGAATAEDCLYLNVWPRRLLRQARACR